MQIGDKITDNDGTTGIIIETARDGTWIRYKCRPHAILADLLTNKGDVFRERTFWAMRKNLKAKE